jgi:hypothetical protein
MSAVSPVMTHAEAHTKLCFQTLRNGHMRRTAAPPDALCPCSKTGSHILEKILQKLGDEAPELDSATQAAVKQVDSSDLLHSNDSWRSHTPLLPWR